MQELRKDSVSFGILMTLNTLLMLFSGMYYVDAFNRLALRLTVRMRREFFKATLRQEIGWHDMAKDQNFAVRITEWVILLEIFIYTEFKVNVFFFF